MIPYDNGFLDILHAASNLSFGLLPVIETGRHLCAHPEPWSLFIPISSTMLSHSHPSIIHTPQALAAVPSPDPLAFLIHAPTETSPVLRATPSTNRPTPPQPAGNQESSALPSPSTSAFSHSWGAIRGSHRVSSALIDVCAGRASRRCWEGGVGWVWD